ncbi:MAG: SDR family NAD(P)-dependent oxidoreductase [Candidatus Lambdaproteobacteria bacterium]|nr:SDR family NAD(P)-dependent oxidoreductase [Candidatus Lambdaproteobacteria bacterium]
MEGLERWKGRVALVTGASSGIGRATALALGGAGLRVALAARTGSRLAEVRREIEAGRGAALDVPTDLRDEAAIVALFRAVRARWGGVDVLINSAGIGVAGSLLEGRTDDWREMLEINVLSLSVCIREAVQDMTGKTDAQIVNLSSLAGHRYLPGQTNVYYSAAKHGVRVITEGLRAELAQRRSPIKVGMISPGLVRTEFHPRAARHEPWRTATDADFEFLRAEDVAAQVLHLLAAPRHVQIHDIVLRPIGQPF